MIDKPARMYAKGMVILLDVTFSQEKIKKKIDQKKEKERKEGVEVGM
jgi:hypothetical protein